MKNECEWCGDEYKVYPSNVDTSRFCSRECRTQSQSEEYNGEGNPNWSGGKSEQRCDYCGSTFEEYDSQIDTQLSFCSKECYKDYKSEQIGSSHRDFEPDAHVVLECEQCSEVYTHRADRAEESRFCSKDCMADWQSENVYGQYHHQWSGGSRLSDAIRKVIGEKSFESIASEERKDICFSCGDRPDHTLHVHHIIPLMDGGLNECWNLISLCRSCHRRTDAFYKSEVGRIIDDIVKNETG